MSTTTHRFKTVGDRALEIDVHVPAGTAPRAAIVWLHGGALIFGSRQMLPQGQLERYLEAGYLVAAPDYRLAPEFKLPRIMGDVFDAIGWVREAGPRLFGVDPARLAVVGHSAGGYLTLLVGSYLRPRPRALVAFYGYGDIAGRWYSEPSPFYCRQPLVTEAEARAVVGEGAGAASPTPDRYSFYLYCRQQGVWPREVAGFDPVAEREALASFCPVTRVDDAYPPTLLLHGDEDSDVPYEASVAMAAALSRAGVEHRLVTIAGGGHGFDARLSDPAAAAAFEDVLAFLVRHV